MNKPIKKVLIVDDDAWLSDSYGLLLKKHGWQVAATQKASEAIDLIDDFKPDVILLDFMLPYASAPALLNELQSHGDTAKVPVVLCSSLDLDSSQFESLESYGVKQIIQKTTATPRLIIKSLENAV